MTPAFAGAGLFRNPVPTRIESGAGSRLRLAIGRRPFLEQRDHGTRTGVIAQTDREGQAFGRADAGDAPRRPVGLADHVAAGRDLLDHRLVDAVLPPFAAATV